MESAFGKVILLGEHAVVHGRPAIAASLPRGAEARAEPDPSGPRLVVPAWGVELGGVELGAADASELGRAFAALLDFLEARALPVKVVVEPRIPAGGGLGCSAAMGVAAARALARAQGRSLTVPQASDAGLAWERVIHGNPSGVDNLIAAGGGLGVYRRGGALEPLALGAPVWLAVGDTGQPGSTRAMVESVARQRERKPEVVDKVLDGIGALVEAGASALRAGDARRLGQLFDLNQTLLSALLVSTAEIEEMCVVARAAGAFGAKLTGGGGGGSVIAVTDRPDEVVRAWQAQGRSGFTAQLVPPAPATRELR